MACYRYSLIVSGQSKDDSVTNDEDFQRLVEGVKESVPVLPFIVKQESELLEIAVKPP